MDPHDRAPARPLGRKPPPQGARALLVAVVLLFALAGVMGWLVASGVSRGETTYPSKRAFLRRSVLRQQEPGMYWVSVGIYTVVGCGALTLAVLGLRAGRRLHR